MKTTSFIVFYFCSPVTLLRSGRGHALSFAALQITMMPRITPTVHLSLKHKPVTLMPLASATVGVTQIWGHACLWGAALVERECSPELYSVNGVMGGLLKTG
jgi:hypothetical protein